MARANRASKVVHVDHESVPVAHLRVAVEPRSYLPLSPGASDAVPPQKVQELCKQRATSTITPRTKVELEGP